MHRRAADLECLGLAGFSWLEGLRGQQACLGSHFDLRFRCGYLTAHLFDFEENCEAGQ